MTRTSADLLLLLMVAIWGLTFPQIKSVTRAWPEHLGTFLALRFWVATLGFLPLLLRRERPLLPRHELQGGLVAGIALLAGYAFQTAGLVHTNSSTAAFLTGASVVLVPLGAWWFGRPVPLPAMIGLLLALPGIALLALRPGESLVLGGGELLVFACAIAFAAQIVSVDLYARRVDAVRFTMLQCLIAAVGTTIWALAIELPTSGPPPWAGNVVLAVLVCGLLATTLAFLLQTVAQRITSATHVAVIFATEPLFGAWFGWWLDGDLLSPRMWAGCALILLGMLVAELGGAVLRKLRGS
jgi:drug/metabolite transporter (DMT)-like permease